MRTSPIASRVGLVMVLAGGISLAYGIARVMSYAGCESARPGACVVPPQSVVLWIAGGIILSVIGAIVARAGGLALAVPFCSVGAGSLVGGLGDNAAGGRLFPVLFGAGFLIGGLAPLLVGGLLLRKQRRGVELRRVGRRAIGTVVSVRDTNVTINNDPRVTLVFSIAPLDGEPPFEAEKTVTVPRIAIPAAGDRFPVWVDPIDRTEFAFAMADSLEGRQTLIDEFGVDPWTKPGDAVRDPYVPPPVSSPQPEPGGATEAVIELERLGRLHREGGLTDEEFAQMKDAVIRGATGGTS